MVAAIPLFLLAVALLPGNTKAHLRFDRLQGVGTRYERLNSFSAGRIEGYRQAIALAAQRPLHGHGFGNYQLKYDGASASTEVHNLWLRMLVEAGIALPMIFLMLATSVLLASYRRMRWCKRHNRDSKLTWSSAALSAVIVTGMVLASVEPNVLLGSYQNSSIWWVCVGIVIALPRAKDNQRSVR
jgi:O-antigen ligase